MSFFLTYSLTCTWFYEGGEERFLQDLVGKRDGMRKFGIPTRREKDNTKMDLQ